METILHCFSERKPFSKDSRELRSLSSGVVADKHVDVDRAESLGQAMLQSMYGKSVADYKVDKTGIKVQHSASDADYNIVSTACTMTKRRSVTIGGDDTYQLVLMLHNLRLSNHNIFFQTASKIINILTLQDYVNADAAASPMLFQHPLRMQHCVQTIWNRKADGNGQM